MIKGIAIRRTFNLAEVILGVILIVILGFAIHAFTRPPTTLSSSETLDAEPTVFNKIAALSTFSFIDGNGLFGPAAKLASKEKLLTPIPKDPDEGIEVETSLPLTLKGVVVSKPPWASATIEVREKGSFTDTFYLDQEIIDGVILKEIRKKEIVMVNKRQNSRREVLKLTYLMTSKAGKSTRSQPTIQRSRPTNRATTAAKPTRNQTITLSKKEISDQLNADYEKFASTADIKVVEEDGKVKGITTDNIEDIPSAKRLGFKNGDVLVSVNNEKVTSVDQIQKIANKYQNAPTLRIGILRDNQPMTFNYRLR